MAGVSESRRNLTDCIFKTSIFFNNMTVRLPRKAADFKILPNKGNNDKVPGMLKTLD